MNVFAHPALCSSADLIWALQERLGMRAVVEGARVRMIGPARPSGRPLAVVERSAGRALRVVK